MSSDKLTAREEVNKTLKYCNFSTRNIAISFIDDPPSSFKDKLKKYLWFIFSISALAALIAGEMAYVVTQIASSTSVAAFVTGLHIVGYGSMSLCKGLMLWFKASWFRKVVNELVELWPVSIADKDAAYLKRRTLSALRFVQLAYLFWTLMGAFFYNGTPIALYFYRLARGLPANLGFIWFIVYPFDKTKPVVHEFVFAFEVFSGIVSVWAQLGADLMFTTMASHISMLLRLLQLRIRNIGNSMTQQVVATATRGEKQDVRDQGFVDCYDEIISVIKTHQRLIKYSKDLEDVFSVVNLINVMLSSVNICCVVFIIVLLEPWMVISNKLFLGAALTQVGIICWYADEIFTASMGVADAAYESGWYKCNPHCRRALLLLLRRSQKPLYFTAFKFRNITLTTYNSILTTSYSYFTLLYTMYRE